jgi:3D (Asp-Asp-Asp) domain-containing protein
MHTIDNSFARLFVVPAAILAVFSAVGCGAQNLGADGEPLPGHGMASRSYDLSLGDTTNPYDTTDDPTDPSFVPQAAQLKPQVTHEVGRSQEALSTTYGTTFQLTYYVVSHRPTYDPYEVDIRDCAGNVLTHASRAWRDDAIMQGTARFKNSAGATVTINDGGGCWITLPYSQRWGLGVTNAATGNPYELRAFRSIAVDPTVLQMGKWYYIKELDGVTMPSPASGLVHDGCVRAMDVGPAIIGRHIDFFSGYYSAYQTLINGSSTMGGKESITLYDGAAKCDLHIQRGY